MGLRRPGEVLPVIAAEAAVIELLYTALQTALGPLKPLESGCRSSPIWTDDGPPPDNFQSPGGRQAPSTITSSPARQDRKRDREAKPRRSRASRFEVRLALDRFFTQRVNP